MGQVTSASAVISFTGPFRFLSNFYFITIDFENDSYPSVEHAYQAAKTNSRWERERILACRSPGQAKRLGREVAIRPDWYRVKLPIMKQLVCQKFWCYPDLAKRLLATGDVELVEGNHWHDTFWGQCPIGVGFNHLGRILMEVRRELAEGRGASCYANKQQ